MQLYQKSYILLLLIPKMEKYKQIITAVVFVISMATIFSENDLVGWKFSSNTKNSSFHP